MITQAELTEALLAAPSLSAFLEQVFAAREAGGLGLSYAELARRAGFRSRSYPREVCLGRRGLTLKSLAQFQRGLRLQPSAAQCLAWLAMLEHPALNPTRLDPEQIRERLAAERRKLAKRSSTTSSTRTDIFRVREWPYVYAVIHAREEGWSLDEVAERTRLPAAVCQRALAEMVRWRIVSCDETGRYHPRHDHLSYVEQADRGFFQQFFLEALRRVEREARASFAGEERLFLSSIYSVPKAKLPELKRELKEVLVRFIDASEVADADQVCTLICGLVPSER